MFKAVLFSLHCKIIRGDTPRCLPHVGDCRVGIVMVFGL